MLKADKNKKKNKLLLAVIALLFVMGCASQKYVVMSKDIFQTCKPVSAHTSVSHKKTTEIFFLRYQNCFKYEDLLIVTWQQYNVTDTHAVFNYLLPRYLKKISKEAFLVQHENWVGGFYLIFQLAPERGVTSVTVPR